MRTSTTENHVRTSQNTGSRICNLTISPPLPRPPLSLPSSPSSTKPTNPRHSVDKTNRHIIKIKTMGASSLGDIGATEQDLSGFDVPMDLSVFGEAQIDLLQVPVPEVQVPVPEVQVQVQAPVPEVQVPVPEVPQVPVPEVPQVQGLSDIFDLPITGVEIFSGSKRKSSSSPGSKKKRSKDVDSTFIPLESTFEEVNGHVELDVKTTSSFIMPNKKGVISAIDSRFNFFLSLAFAMSGNYTPLLELDSRINLDMVVDIMKKMSKHYLVCKGDGFVDILIRRISLNDLFATTEKSEPTDTKVRSKLLTEIVYGKSIDGDKPVSLSNIRGMSTHMNTYKSRYGIQYLSDGMENVFKFRISSV